MRFKGKRALVTGAAGGIGAVIVSKLRSEGAVVTGADLTACKANHSIQGNLADAQFCDSLVGEACDAMGGLDCLVNNAGIITRGPITRTSDADFARTMAVNVEAPFRLCRAAIPVLAANGGGAIVNTSSCWGRSSRPQSSGLCHVKSRHCLPDPMSWHGPCP